MKSPFGAALPCVSLLTSLGVGCRVLLVTHYAYLANRQPAQLSRDHQDVIPHHNQRNAAAQATTIVFL